MQNERQYLAQVAAATPRELIDLVRDANEEQAQVLEISLGAEAFSELRQIASQGLLRAGQKGNVVVLPGIMGSELSRFEPKDTDLLWVNLFRLAFGAFRNLSLDASGSSVSDVRATGMYQRFYGLQQASLAAEGWNVRAFFYDWRRNIRDEADRLAASIHQWFPNQPVHLVAHSMGGLVSRAMIARHGELWKSMADPDGLRRGGRLIMLGTPNYGAFGSVQFLFGRNDVLRVVAKLDLRSDTADLLNTSKTFVAVYHMLPALSQEVSDPRLFDVRTYTSTSVDPARLQDAKEFHNEIAGAVDPARMIYVAGAGFSTPHRVADFSRLGDTSGYVFSEHGDGTVPHNLGLLKDVPTFYLNQEHQKLPNDRHVRAAMSSLLLDGALPAQSALQSTNPLASRGAEDEEGVRAREAARIGSKEAMAEALSNAASKRGQAEVASTSPEEQKLADLMLLHSPQLDAFDEIEREQAAAAKPQTVRVRINLFEGNLEKVGPLVEGDPCPVDVVFVGHYAGLEAYGAFLSLDEEISKVLGANHFLSTARERGVISTARNALTFLPDPRTDRKESLIALMGMGLRDEFGFPELAGAVRELIWAASRLGKKHIAATLMGKRSLSVADSVHGWVDGLSRALRTTEGVGIQSITFVVRTSGREVADALHREKEAIARFADIELDVSVPKPPPKPRRSENPIVPPTRISIDFQGGRFKFSAIGSDASIPVRDFRLSEQRVDDLNARILALQSRVPITQKDRQDIEHERYKLGRFLLSFLFPREFQSELVGSAPILLACNNAAARIYWELAAQSVLDDGSGLALSDRYLGLARGLTRQLSTVLASAQGVTARRRNRIRVLIVADPSKEQPLAFAREEAIQLKALFDEFNRLEGPNGRHIDYTALIGPSEAKSLDFLVYLQNEEIDVLHYSGHCFFNASDPAASGFIFSREGKPDCVTADDLTRLGKVPRFVFANACESGVLPSRLDRASAMLAPSFAEAFFERGVGNFVCTAWPVLDQAAITFAVAMYSQLLGMHGSQFIEAAPMWRAMREARKSIIDTPSWPAYQHYGDPNFWLIADR